MQFKFNVKFLYPWEFIKYAYLMIKYMIKEKGWVSVDYETTIPERKVGFSFKRSG